MRLLGICLLLLALYLSVRLIIDSLYWHRHDEWEVYPNEKNKEDDDDKR